VTQAIHQRDEAEEELQTLLAKQRRYYRAVRELQDAFVENERLRQNRTKPGNAFG
jgi:hypothetical protein